MLDSQLLSAALSIDQEHQAIFRTLNTLMDASLVDQTAKQFQEAVAGLGITIKQHFENEEGILRTCGMPADDVDKHIQGHGFILDKFAQLEADLMSVRSIDRSALIHTINGMLHSHDIEFDNKLKQYLIDVDGPDKLVLERVCRNLKQDEAPT